MSLRSFLWPSGQLLELLIHLLIIFLIILSVKFQKIIKNETTIFPEPEMSSNCLFCLTKRLCPKSLLKYSHNDSSVRTRVKTWCSIRSANCKGLITAAQLVRTNSGSKRFQNTLSRERQQNSCFCFPPTQELSTHGTWSYEVTNMCPAFRSITLLNGISATTVVTVTQCYIYATSNV